MADAGIHVIDDLDQAAATLNPLRLRLLAALTEPDSAAAVARRFGISRQHVNYHLRQLEAVGLVETVGERRSRGCLERLVRSVARSYLISPRVLGELAPDPGGIEGGETREYLVASAASMIGEVTDLEERQDPTGRPLEAMTIRAEVRLPAPGLQRMFMEDLSEAVGRVVARYHDEGGTGARRLRVLVGAYPSVAAGQGGRGSRRTWASKPRPMTP